MSLWHPCQFDPAQKPEPGTAEVDWGHPLADRLHDCLAYDEGAGGRVANLASPAPATVTGAWVATAGGAGLRSAGGTGVSIPTHGNLVAGDVSVRVRFRLDAGLGGTYTCLVEKGAGPRELGWFLNTSGNVQYVDIGGSAVDGLALPTGVATLGATYDLVLVRRGTTLSAYRDGRLAGTSGATFAGTTAVAQPTAVGYPVSANTAPSITVTQYEARRRAMTAGEIAWLAAEPYAVLRPVAPHRTYSVGAGFNAAYYRQFVANRGAA